MTTYMRRNGKVVEKHLAPLKNPSRKGPSVIRDEIDATRHMADGQLYTSKSKFRQATKDNGCIEVGSDSSMYRPRAPVKMDRGQRRDDIRKAIYELRNGR